MRFFVNLHRLSDWGLRALRVGVGMSFWVHGRAIQLKAVQMHRRFGVDGGWELDVVLLTAALALVFLGAGAISVDRLLFGL